MNMILRGGVIFRDGVFEKADLLVSDGIISRIAPSISAAGVRVFEIEDQYVFPGFTDVHVHLREPGFSYKETIFTGTQAAARGGYTAVCAMPNLAPVPDCAENLEKEFEKIRSQARVRVYPFGSITKGEKGAELSDMEVMAASVAGYSDDGKGVQFSTIMLRAMEKATKLGKIIVAHCEDESAPEGEREWREAVRNIELAGSAGCALHICHVSKKETVEAVRRGKAQGVNVTCETAPHYLLLTNEDVSDDGKYRMNPPLGAAADQKALLDGLRDGTIDMIATDHAPHSREEKAGGFRESLSGIVGLECAFPALYTGLVEQGRLTLRRLLELMAIAPVRRFGTGNQNGIEIGAAADLAIFDLNTEYEIDPERFASMGRSTPFAGWRVKGKCIMTLADGDIIWEEKDNA